MIFFQVLTIILTKLLILLLSLDHHNYWVWASITASSTSSTTTEDEPLHLPGPQLPNSLPWSPNNQPPEEGARALPVALMQPQALTFLDPCRKYYWDWETLKSTLHPVFHKSQQYLHGQCPSNMALCPIYLSPHSGKMAKPPVINKNSIS